ESAWLMHEDACMQSPVVEEDRLVGLLSHREVLATWGAYTDARTGLPGADLMRRWASGHLTAGREVAIVFIDLNNFKQFNKIHGHVVGDRDIKAIALEMRQPV